jgi:hypothetical protein
MGQALFISTVKDIKVPKCKHLASLGTGYWWKNVNLQLKFHAGWAGGVEASNLCGGPWMLTLCWDPSFLGGRVVLGIELRASWLLGGRSTSWVTPPALLLWFVSQLGPLTFAQGQLQTMILLSPSPM